MARMKSFMVEVEVTRTLHLMVEVCNKKIERKVKAR